MTQVIIDNSKFPERKVIRVQPSWAPGASRLMTLECGHKVGLRDGFAVPAIGRCKECYES